MRVGLVIENFEVLVLVLKQAGRATLDVELGIGVGLARKLKLDLFEVIVVEVAVPTRPDKVADLEIALLSHHVG